MPRRATVIMPRNVSILLRPSECASTPLAAGSQLTAEEKKAKLEDALAKARAKKAGTSVEEEKQKEKARREGGKNLVASKREFEDQQRQARAPSGIRLSARTPPPSPHAHVFAPPSPARTPTAHHPKRRVPTSAARSAMPHHCCHSCCHSYRYRDARSATLRHVSARSENLNSSGRSCARSWPPTGAPRQTPPLLPLAAATTAAPHWLPPLRPLIAATTAATHCCH